MGMGRPKGLAKTGGRKLGTPNKNSHALSERLERLGCDPIEGLAKIALDPATKPELKVLCFAELAQYVYPKRKAVDLGLNEGTRVSALHPAGCQLCSGSNAPGRSASPVQPYVRAAQTPS